MKNITKLVKEKVSALKGRVNLYKIDLDTKQKLERLNVEGDYGIQTQSEDEIQAYNILFYSPYISE